MMRTALLRETRHDFFEEHILERHPKCGTMMHWEKGISGAEDTLLSCKVIAGWGRMENALNTEDMLCIRVHVHTCVCT